MLADETADPFTAAVDLPNVAFGETRAERFKGIEEPITVCSAAWR